MKRLNITVTEARTTERTYQLLVPEDFEPCLEQDSDWLQVVAFPTDYGAEYVTMSHRSLSTEITFKEVTCPPPA